MPHAESTRWAARLVSVWDTPEVLSIERGQVCWPRSGMSQTPKPAAAEFADRAAGGCRGRARRRWIAAAVLGGAALVAGAEGVARFGLGLGDPPLSDAYPDMEYAFRPGTYRRFGNTIHINSHLMRAAEFPAHKPTDDEVRVMLMGDSVINGGSLTDQESLASALLQRSLEQRLRRPVVVGNISAGSWGPGNLLAYARRFGFFDADVVAIVLNSADASDNPTIARIVGVDPAFPDTRPWSALTDGLTRYVIPRIWRATGNVAPAPDRDDPAAGIARGMQDLGTLCDMATATGARVVIVHFPNRDELGGRMLDGHGAIASCAAGRGLELVELRPALAASLAGGHDPYRERDPIHPNETGQRIIAYELVPLLLRVLARPAAIDESRHEIRNNDDSAIRLGHPLDRLLSDPAGPCSPEHAP